MNAALELHGVAKRYGRLTALDGLDLVVPSGSVFGMVGSNGAGKTTAMAITLGLLRPNSGQIDILGKGPFHPTAHVGRVSLLPQDSRFPSHSRVEELLRLYGRLQGLGEQDLARSIEELLDWVHLRDRRNSPVRTLSHGMARRMAIAQAFLGYPELVLLDEPLNGLDPREAARARDMIRQRRGRQTIVISSHHLADIEAVCDTVAFIEKGRCVRQDSLETIIHRRHQITYVLSDGAVPLEKLHSLFTDVRFESRPDKPELKASFPNTYAPEEINRRVLEVLLQANIGILEIRRGSDLETEYLNASGSASTLGR
jgi:ABC-type multidrug transport system ATPase subunit